VLLRGGEAAIKKPPRGLRAAWHPVVIFELGLSLSRRSKPNAPARRRREVPALETHVLDYELCHACEYGREPPSEQEKSLSLFRSGSTARPITADALASRIPKTLPPNLPHGLTDRPVMMQQARWTRL
jgi:hypothetical protein